MFLTELRHQQPAVAKVRQSTCKASILDPYKPYLLQRWQEGCWNGIHRYGEIRAQGFTGSQSTVRNFLADLRQKQHLVGDASILQWDTMYGCVILPNELPPKRTGTRRISPARASWLVFLLPERLTDRQRDQQEQVRYCHPDVETAATLVSEFVQIVMQRHAEALDNWLTRATQS